jgi:pimeloyl-ACP methyl ester carboxylesterase
MTDAPSRFVESTDGTRIALFSQGRGSPIVLVHGTSADHTTFRVVAPLLAERHTVHAIDRRGRGASGDAGAADGERSTDAERSGDYTIEREYDDVAAVVDAVATDAREDVDVVGHSFGGRVALGAALRTPRLQRLVVYEGAPPAPDEPYQEADLRTRLQAVLREEGPARLYEVFLAEVIGMGDDEIAVYRANTVWPARVAAAPTILRELDAEASPAAGLDALSGVAGPVLQILGGDSRGAFRRATQALDAQLRDGRVTVIDGARHAAHHTHPREFVAAIEAFLAAPAGGSAASHGTMPGGGPAQR